MVLATVEDPVSSRQEELETIFEEYHAMVLRTAWRVTGNVTDAEDVLQTVFLRLLRRKECPTPFRNVEAYLRRAAINAGLDVVRARREHVPVEAALTGEPAAGVPSAVERQDLHEILRRTLATLPPMSAEILIMRFFEGYSNGEIAGMLGVSALRVAVVVHRGRRKLQEKFRRYEGARP